MAVPQRTDAWFARRGLFFTATEISRLMTKKISLTRLLDEKTCGVWFGPSSDAMQWGTDREEAAVHAFRFSDEFAAYGPGAMLTHDVPGPVSCGVTDGSPFRWIAADTDAVIHGPASGNIAVVEIKCPYSRDAKEVLSDKMHLIQCHVEQLCFGVQTAYLVCAVFVDTDDGGSRAELRTRKVPATGLLLADVAEACQYLSDHVHPLLRARWRALAALYDV